MRDVAMLLGVTLLASAGCKPPMQKPTKPTERAGGLISQIHDRVDEAVVMEMIKNLHLHILQEESTGQMPTPESLREYAKAESKKTADLFEKGVLVLPEKMTRSGVWVYEKDVPTKGGWIAVQAGPRKVTAEEFKQLIGN